MLEADPPVKYELVEHLTKSWDLAPLTSPNVQRVFEGQVVIAEVKISTLTVFVS